MSTAMVLPDFGGHSNTAIVPALTWGTPCQLLPDAVMAAPAVVLLVLDSLGWMQLDASRDVAPTLSAMEGGSVTTVAPSTTAAALTSISTGVPPGEHGIVGYRFAVGGGVMNALRWTVSGADHRDVAVPNVVQAAEPFSGGSWDVISQRQFRNSALTEAYLGDRPYHGYDHPSSIAAIATERVRAGDRRVYAYYDGLDHVAHIYGVSGPHFRTELAFCDWLVDQLLQQLPTGTALVVTADHGQIDAPDLLPVHEDVLRMVRGRSGEPRFRWLHAAPGATGELAAAAQELHGSRAWVRTREQVIDEGWFGPNVTDAARNRLGDVALVAHEPVGFEDPEERYSDRLRGRHGSLTEAEMLVPVLSAVV